MADIIFNEEQSGFQGTTGHATASTQPLVSSVARLFGGLLTERQVRYLLIGVSVLVLLFALLMLIPALTPISRLPAGHVTPPPGAPPGWAPPGSNL